MTDPAHYLQADISKATLNIVVERVLGRPIVRLGAWSIAPLTHRVINRVTAGLWRVTGDADDGIATLPWSLVIKDLHRLPDEAGSAFNAGDAPDHWNYWRREAHVYANGLLGDLPAGLAAPRCLLVEEAVGDVVRLWLEDVSGNPATRWSLPRFGLAARHLGRWQGSILTGDRLIADAPWLSRRWLRTWVPDDSAIAPALSCDPAAWRHPLLRDAMPPDTSARVASLAAARWELLSAIEQSQRTLCHLDLWPRNLFGRLDRHGDQETVLIDWSFVGEGALGEDIANLVLDGVWMRCLDGADLPTIERLVLDGYEAGLRAAGWSDSAVARWLYAAVGALRFGLLAGTLLTMAHDDTGYPELARRYGEPAEVTIRQRAMVVGRALALADEALGTRPPA